MVFTSTVFLVLFLPVTLAIYYNPFFKSRSFRNIFLLVASLLFYAWGEPVYVFLMILCIIAGWVIGGKIQRNDDTKIRKRWLTLGITIYILVFFIFKYLTFLAGQICILLNFDQSMINIALPIGISFFLFQLMSYLFDIYYRNAKAQEKLLYVGLYISLFPQLIAGPIVRYADIENQIENRVENMIDFSSGIMRFSVGLGKKVLLADYLGTVTDYIFAGSDEKSVLTAWLGALAYTLQIFFDFSGYSDMAIGLGSMFGFKFNENFNYPYISRSVTEFWRRWHISLSTWFRDYVYIPMGGNRVNKSRWVFNLFVVWALTGIWHGANWTFLLWGLIYFAVLLIEKRVLSSIKNIPSVIGHIYTMLIVVIAWVIFRSDSITLAFSYIEKMFSVGEYGFVDDTALYYLDNAKWVFLAAIAFSMPVGVKIIDFLRRHRLYWMAAVFNVLIFVLALSHCIATSYSPFIYFNF